MWNRSLYAIGATSTRRDDCDAAQRDGPELAPTALEVARVTDECLAAALAAADVGAVHADDVVAALVAAAERGREAVAHPARRDGLLGRLQRRQRERRDGVGGRPLALASGPRRRDDGRRRLRGLAFGRAEHRG